MWRLRFPAQTVGGKIGLEKNLSEAFIKIQFNVLSNLIQSEENDLSPYLTENGFKES